MELFPILILHPPCIPNPKYGPTPINRYLSIWNQANIKPTVWEYLPCVVHIKRSDWVRVTVPCCRTNKVANFSICRHLTAVLIIIHNKASVALNSSTEQQQQVSGCDLTGKVKSTSIVETLRTFSEIQSFGKISWWEKKKKNWHHL